MTRCILVALDGLRPDLVDPARTPHLAALAAAATRLAHARSVFRAGTRVATPSPVTGRRSAGHGMVANALFDAALGADRLLRTKLLGDLHTLAAGREAPLERPCLAEPLAAAGLRFAPVSAGTRAHTACCTRRPNGSAPSVGMWRTAAVPGPARWKPPSAPPRPPRCPTWRASPSLGACWSRMGCPLPPRCRAAVAERAGHQLPSRGPGSPAGGAARHAAAAVPGRIIAWCDAQPDAAEIAIITLSDDGHVTGRGKLCLASALQRAGLRTGAGLGGGGGCGGRTGLGPRAVAARSVPRAAAGRGAGGLPLGRAAARARSLPSCPPGGPFRWRRSRRPIRAAPIWSSPSPGRRSPTTAACPAEPLRCAGCAQGWGHPWRAAPGGARPPCW